MIFPLASIANQLGTLDPPMQPHPLAGGSSSLLKTLSAAFLGNQTSMRKKDVAMRRQLSARLIFSGRVTFFNRFQLERHFDN
jgi:hypothetical protein